MRQEHTRPIDQGLPEGKSPAARPLGRGNATRAARHDRTLRTARRAHPAESPRRACERLRGGEHARLGRQGYPPPSRPWPLRPQQETGGRPRLQSQAPADHRRLTRSRARRKNVVSRLRNGKTSWICLFCTLQRLGSKLIVYERITDSLLRRLVSDITRKRGGCRERKMFRVKQVRYWMR